MSSYVLVWDLETVPDLDAVGRVHDLEDGDFDGAREILGGKFPKHPFHKIICIGAIIAKRSERGWEIVSKGAPHAGERPEKELIRSFVNRIAELQPTLVTFNGSGFDLPVLRYRAIVHRISAPGLAALPYFNRYSQQSVDLCDVLASYGTARATLHEISKTLGFPGKASGIDGSDVAGLYAEGRIEEISAYCLEDVNNTYRMWLAHELFCGRLTEDQYKASDALANPDPGREVGVIRTQQQWEAVKGRYRNASDYRSFRRDFTFDPAARLTRTSLSIREALPRAREGGARWRIFEQIGSSMTVDELNRAAAQFENAEWDADVFIALYTGFMKLEET